MYKEEIFLTLCRITLYKRLLYLKLITVTRASGLSDVERGINDELNCRRTEHSASEI
jgi:hypothetical protein